jgi:hypothetical protein
MGTRGVCPTSSIFKLELHLLFIVIKTYWFDFELELEIMIPNDNI